MEREGVVLLQEFIGSDVCASCFLDFLVEGVVLCHCLVLVSFLTRGW